MTVYQALKKGARISNGDKWLIKDCYDNYIIYQRPYGAKKNKVLRETSNIEYALDILMEE